ncbi:MAG: four helix bundle protein [Candidatus Omnitrophica bacterium]|nr:four helix bundle protein [Candidatus Omnitrophota bacterium]
MSEDTEKKGYKRLEVWKRAHKLVILVYKYTRDFPKEEEYGLTSQLRRAALSVSANIVEGQASSSKREFLNFLNIANRSLVETEYLLEVAVELKYLSKERYDEMDNLRYEIGIFLNGLTRSIRTKL